MSYNLSFIVAVAIDVKRQMIKLKWNENIPLDFNLLWYVIKTFKVEKK